MQEKIWDGLMQSQIGCILPPGCPQELDRWIRLLKASLGSVHPNLPLIPHPQVDSE